MAALAHDLVWEKETPRNFVINFVICCEFASYCLLCYAALGLGAHAGSKTSSDSPAVIMMMNET